MTFRPALDAALRAFAATGGAAVGVYGPTPALVQQLLAGAPADILFTADPAWMDTAVAKGLIAAATRTTVFGNDLVLAGASGARQVGVIGRDFALLDLLAGGRLAMCDPDHDPAGRFARESLVALGFWDGVSPHIAIAESSPAAVRLLASGEVKAATCFATDLHGAGPVSLVGRFPADSHSPIVHPMALTARTRHPHAADTLSFLKSPTTVGIFRDFGYTTVG